MPLGVLARRKTFLKTELFENDGVTISLPEFCSNANPKWPVIVTFSNFSGVVRTGPHKYQSEHGTSRVPAPSAGKHEQ